jgi:hypothetical protein
MTQITQSRRQARPSRLRMAGLALVALAMLAPFDLANAEHGGGGGGVTAAAATTTATATRS